VSLESNVDGESVEYAARRLSKQSASRHVMIVLSDGNPACHGDAGQGVLEDDLRDRVKRIQDGGIDVVGIGIQDDSVKQFYKRNVVINNVSDLPNVVIHQLRDLLLPGK
jgi:cobalamin biosynthesis protein CobT